MNQVCFRLGDPSHDGHGISYDKWVDVSCTLDELRDAYIHSHETVGFAIGWVRDGVDFPNNLKLCMDYENNIISPEIVQILIDRNCPLVAEFGFTLDGEDFDANWINDDIFIEILMWYIGESLDFSWSRSKKEIPVFDNSYIGSFGYGLYSK
jgi:hypothetical protein